MRSYALLLLLFAGAGLVAILSNRITTLTRVPAPAILLVASAAVVQIFPEFDVPTREVIERLVTVGLIFILFEGGMHIGWSRFKASAARITVVGVAGTFLTVVGVAVFAHFAIGLAWYAAVLVATAVSPTDPAVVFSVLGQREIASRSGVILEGESGANDPVGIALMGSLVAAGSLSGGALADVGKQFLLEMLIGAAIGIAGGLALSWFMQRIPLPNEGLYPLRTLAIAVGIYGAGAVAEGSGFLAVFVAGILIGDIRAPYKREVEQFHSALASLGEVVAFIALGLTVDLANLTHFRVWGPGLLLAVVLTLVIRPLLVAPCLLGSGLPRGERAFVLLSGLKGAVPILLGILLLGAEIYDRARLFGIVVVVVIFSVAVQGSLVPLAAKLLKVPMRNVPQEPWSLGIRLRDEPAGVQRLRVRAGSSADGRTVADLDRLPGTTWISFLVRDGLLVSVSRDTLFRAGDEVLLLADESDGQQLRDIFESKAHEQSATDGS